MDTTDLDLFDNLNQLRNNLGRRIVLLTHTGDVDVLAEGLRDLGHDLHDVGEEVLARVAELDTADVSQPRETPSTLTELVASSLATLPTTTR